MRDRAVDALRAYAIGGVVLGHWLVTALVLTPDGTVHQISPLATMPALAPASWLFQTLGLFFFTAGHAAAHSLAGFPGHPARWLLRRLGRLVLPALALLGLGAAGLLVAIVLGTRDDILSVAVTLTASPLWFLLPLVALSALTAPLRAAVRRWGPVRCVLPAVAVVAGTDLAVRLPAARPWLLPVAVLAAWSVPYLLGLAHAEGRLAGRRPAVALVAVGAVALAALLALGYPASAVGVPGAGRSNLSPPSLFAIALAVAQVGAGLLAGPALRRLGDRPAPARLVRGVNRHAMRVYLCHQPVLVGVSALTARFAGPQPGLHTPPDGPGWLAARLCWLPLLALVLAVLVRSRSGAVAGAVGRTARADRSAEYGVPARRVYDDPRLRAGSPVTFVPRRPEEVIAVRDGDPSSRGRADRQPR
ncbi:acyltransferase [Micromonospora sp. DR5-3]|uniref:acyltransferase family protein n=1 Tax=unclassified Micromonospora TaxID=2617518 RepID=UPI0011DC39A8|nr:MULTISPECIES: acyltransferase [unclassified Micromonospora]MCW3819369.1 acyltransferase [Micromonospora sp. DR5-3]TYC20869.1 acyltransferase [Micromonospora sp. MP36]